MWTSLAETLEARAEASQDVRSRAELLADAARVAEERLSDHERAIRLYRASIDLDAHDPEVLASLGRLFARTRRFDDLSHVYDVQLQTLTDPQQKLPVLFKHAELLATTLDDADGALLRSFTLPRNMNPDLRQSPIPADAPAHVVATTVPLADMAPGARTLIERAGLERVFATAVFAHGHRLLRRVEMVAHEGTADELVLLDIPAWDYDWQGQYIYVDAHAVDVEAPITVRCTYDNTPGNRARVGLDPTSVVVQAGEGTGDEMCIVTLEVVGRDPAP
jgi:hypothetical protein